MKIRNNKELNKVFMIMGIFSIVALFGGIELGFELRDSAYKPEIKEESAEKNIESDDTFNYLDTVISSNLQASSRIYSMSSLSKSLIEIMFFSLKILTTFFRLFFHLTALHCIILLRHFSGGSLTQKGR